MGFGDIFTAKFWTGGGNVKVTDCGGQAVIIDPPTGNRYCPQDLILTIPGPFQDYPAGDTYLFSAGAHRLSDGHWYITPDEETRRRERRTADAWAARDQTTTPGSAPRFGTLGGDLVRRLAPGVLAPSVLRPPTVTPPAYTGFSPSLAGGLPPSLAGRFPGFVPAPPGAAPPTSMEPAWFAEDRRRYVYLLLAMVVIAAALFLVRRMTP